MMDRLSRVVILRRCLTWQTLLAGFCLLGLCGCAPEAAATPVAAVVFTQTAAANTPEPSPSAEGSEVALPTATITPQATSDPLFGLSDSIDAVVQESGGEWHFYIKEMGGEVLYARGERDILHPASVIKVAIAMLFFKALENEVHPADLGSYLKEHGTDGRSYDQLLQAMLVKSEEPAAESLLSWSEDRLRVANILTGWNLPDTQLEPRRTSLTDLERIFTALYTEEWLSADASRYILARMSEYTMNDDLRLGMIRSCQAEGEGFFNKRGTLTEGRLIVGDAAIIERAGKVYFVAVFAYQAPQTAPQTTYERLEAGMGNFAAIFCRYFGKQP
jgi:hypothetical protein